MPGQDFPHEVRTEIFDLLQALKGAWPNCRTLFYTDGEILSGSRGIVERYISAVQWLTDRGLISFEALLVDSTGLSIMDSALTQRGREYSRAHVPVEISARAGNR